MKYDEIKDFKGLFAQPNTFELPKGAMEEAHNVVIEDTDTINKVRGYYKYFSEDQDEEILGITTFDDHLISAYTARMAYYTDTGSAPNITGTETPITTDTPVDISFNTVDTPKFAQANGNLYTACDDGIIKMTDYNAKIYQSGAPPGLDLYGKYNIGAQATWWDISKTDPTSKTVGYRVLFGYEDANNNLIIGAPSGTFTINNPVVIDATVSSKSGAGPYTITVNSPSHGLEDGMNMHFFDANSFGTSDENAEGYYAITYIDADNFSYDVPNDPGSAGGATVSYCYAMETSLTFSVPTQISNDLNTGWFFSLYRSDQQLLSVGVQSDYKLIDQRSLTSAEIVAGVVHYSDGKSGLFKGDILYTNQNSGEGELQANVRPPQAKVMDLYQKYMFYGNCTARHFLQFAVVDPDVFIAGSYLEVRIGTTSRRYYVDTTGPGNLDCLAALSNSAGEILFTYNAHGFPATGLSTVYVSNADSSLADGRYFVIYVSANTFRIADSLANWQAGVGVSYTAETKADFSALYRSQTPVIGSAWTRTSNVVTVTSAIHGLSEGQSLYVDNSAAGAPDIADGIYRITSVPDLNTFTFAEVAADSAGTVDYGALDYVVYDNTATSSPSERIRDCANHLVKAINRDLESLVYADYVSTPIDTPGNIRLRAKDFGLPIYLYVSDATTQEGFFPVIPWDYAAVDQVFSANPSQSNAVYFSKLQEPEAVPIVNVIPVGSGNSEILAIHALTNSIIILKEDGVFRLTGDNPANFVVSLLDATILTVARNSSAVFSNQVALLSNQGICLVSETSIQIISRNIENLIQNAIQASTIDLDTFGFAYELERTFFLTTLDPFGNRVLYAYNVLTDTWTTNFCHFTSAAIGPDKRMYHVNMDKNIIYRERKDTLKTDYTRDNYTITVLDTSNPLQTLIESIDYVPKYGDLIIKSDQVNIISKVTLSSPSRYTVEMFCLRNVEDGDVLQIYESYESTIKIAPYTAGQVGVQKQFSQVQIHFRDRSTTALYLSYASDSFSNSKITEWRAPLAGTFWGKFKWGVEPWGTAASNNFDYTTEPAPVCRTYVSRLSQRSTFFQPRIVNTIGGDRLNIQSVNVAVRNYGERVSK